MGRTSMHLFGGHSPEQVSRVNCEEQQHWRSSGLEEGENISHQGLLPSVELQVEQSLPHSRSGFMKTGTVSLSTPNPRVMNVEPSPLHYGFLKLSFHSL